MNSTPIQQRQSIQPRALGLEDFRGKVFSRLAAASTVMFFSWTFCLSQPAYAVQQKLTEEQRREAALDAMYETSPDAKLAYRLQKLKHKVTGDLAGRVDHGNREAGLWTRAVRATGLGGLPLASSDVEEVRKLHKSINTAWQDVDGDLSDVDRHLKAGKAPAEILARQQAAKDKIKGDYTELNKLLLKVEKAKKAVPQQQAFDELNAFLSKQQFEKTHPKMDPNHLPFGTPEPVKRAPAEDAVALYQATHNDVQLAASTVTPEMLSGVFGGKGGVEADLAETMDTVQSQAIKDLAAQLHNNATEIYTWVANNIRYVPSYGSIQGADMTLQTKRGNAMDTASLLIALLRSAGIPARYAYGTVMMPVDKAMNWVGGVNAPEAATNLMQQGGIPTVLVSTNGVISHVKFEHTWVEAWVGYEPGRGVKEKTGDSWVPMDASYKQYDYTPPTVDLKTAVPFDAQGLANTIQQNTTVNEQEGWVQTNTATAGGTDVQAQIQQSLTDYQTQLQNYLSTQKPDATVGDVLGMQQTRILPARPLAAGLPYQLVVKKSNFSEIADRQRLKFKYELYTSNYGAMGDSLLHIEEPTVKLAGQKIALSYKPATQADADLIASYIPQPDPATGQIDPAKLPKTLPGYLIHLLPELTVGNTVMASSTVQQTMGTELLSNMGYYFPGDQSWHTAENKPIAGQYEAVALDLQGVSAQQAESLKTSLEDTKAKLQAQNFADLTKHQVVGDLLYSTILSYFALNDVQDVIFQSQTNRVQYRAPSRGIFRTDLQTQYWFGIPRNVSASGLMMDVDSSFHTAVQKDNDNSQWIQNNRMLGTRESAMEHTVPEQLFSTPDNPAHGISAVKALQLAAAAGQRIYTITQSNIASAMPNLNLPTSVMDDITSAVAAGKEVTTHQSPVSFYGANEVGYLIIDPQTGAGAYKIAGGEDGAILLITIGVLLAILALSVANPVATIFLLAVSMLFLGCGLSMLYQDDRYFDVYSWISAGLLGALMAEAKATDVQIALVIGLYEFSLILSNLDDWCANPSI